MKLNPNRIVSPSRTAAVGHDQHGWVANEREIKVMFGLTPKAKWPDEGLEGRRIQNVWVTILSKDKAKSMGLFHRARCVCPQCGNPMSVGRLAQHVCVPD